MGAATSETASEPTTDRYRTWEAGEAIDVLVGRTPTGLAGSSSLTAALGRERSIPCHTAARPVALTWAVLPLPTDGVEATPSLPYTPQGGPPMAGRVVPFATSEQTLAAAVDSISRPAEPGGRRAAPITNPHSAGARARRRPAALGAHRGGGHRCRDRRQERGCADQ